MREGIKEILHTLVEALVLVILVVFVFLQGWRATLIPALAVPVSLIGTFAIFPLLGFSINTIALMGLVLAIGIVVDDSIIVVEAVEHNIENGLSPREATLKAMEEVSGPIVATTLVLFAVFVPTVFIPGITGKLYQQFAVTIAISVVISSFNALTLSPALSSLILKPRKKARGPLGAFYRGFNNLFGKATKGYVRLCGFFIRKFVVSLILLVVIASGIGVLGKMTPGGFLPEEDQGYLYAGVQLPDAASLQRTDAATRNLEKIIMETPGVQYCTTVVGYSMLSGVANTYSGFFFITLKPWHERKGPGGEICGHHGQPQPAHGPNPPGGSLCLFAAGHSGYRHLGWGDFHPGGSFRKGYRLPLGKHPTLPRGCPRAAGDRAGHHDLSANGAPTLCRCRPGQGAQAGGKSQAWNVGVPVDIPIFTAGRIGGEVKGAEAFQKQTLYNYIQTVQNALREVDDALVSRLKSGQRLLNLANQVKALKNYARLARLRYDEGFTSYLEVLDAERSLFSVELSYTESQNTLFRSLIDIYKSMGGGWVEAAEAQAISKPVMEAGFIP